MAMAFMRQMLPVLLVTLASALCRCTAGVAHSVTVVLPTPHLTPAGKARQFGMLFFYTDRNMPETSTAFNALLKGEVAQALDELGKIEGSNLPTVQRAYWQNNVAVCFILEGRYKEADELLLQAGLMADEEAIRHNHRVSVYLNESQALHKSRQKPTVAPENPTDAEKTNTGKSKP